MHHLSGSIWDLPSEYIHQKSYQITPLKFGDMAFFLGGHSRRLRHQGPRVGQVAETWRTGGFSTPQRSMISAAMNHEITMKKTSITAGYSQISIVYISGQRSMMSSVVKLWLKKSAVIDFHPTSSFQHLSLCKHEEIWQLIRSNHPLVILKTAGKAHTGKFMQFRLAIGICAGFLSQRAVVISIVSALNPGAIAYGEHSLGGKGIKKLLYTWHLNRSVTSCWPMGSSQSSGPSGCKVRNRLGCPVTLAAPRDCRIEFWRDLLSKFEQEYDGHYGGLSLPLNIVQLLNWLNSCDNFSQLSSFQDFQKAGTSPYLKKQYHPAHRGWARCGVESSSSNGRSFRATDRCEGGAWGRTAVA